MRGHNGRLLRVDLSTGSLETETIDEDVWRLYAGGSLLGTRLLLLDTPPALDAYDPAALLVFASSAVAGHAAAALPLFSVIAKSPLTGGVGEARVEGPFGNALKASGFDVIVIAGASETPAMLAIVDGRPALLDAGDLWGLDTSETVDAVEARLGQCDVAAIGPAGELLVRFASIVADRSFAARRMGLGAVMGAKRLKAMAIRGGVAPTVADPRGLEELTREYAARVQANPVTKWQHDPPGFGAWVGTAPAGVFAVENFRTVRFVGPAGYTQARFTEHLAWARSGCPGCPSDCIKGFSASADSQAIAKTRQRRGGGLHQEAIAALGPNLGLTKVGEALALHELCLRAGMDAVSLGFTLSFAMECRENGLIGPAQLDGIEPRFGDFASAMSAAQRIAAREGGGDWLAEGARRAAADVAPDAARFAMEVKGLELTPFDPRAQTGLALGFATAPFGPRYDVAEHDLDYDEAMPSWPHALDLSHALGIHSLMPATAQNAEKTRRYATLAEFWSALDALLICPFASAPVRILSLDAIAALVQALTGWDTDGAEVIRWGTRRLNLMRLYNAREGINAIEDRLPRRFFEEPLDAGPFAGARLDERAFSEMIATYYELMGWDRDGVPTPATLARQGLEWTRTPSSRTGKDGGWATTQPNE